MEKQVRVRIAPSPTGEPHVGTAYMALFNRLFAKVHGGKFILRIEDTDQGRSTSASEQSIFDSLNWLGLEWDEGPDKGGPYAPYRQSERLDIYNKYIQYLLDNGKAYRCFCTKQDLDAMRKKQESEKRAAVGYFSVDSPCRNLSASESKERADRGEAFVVRLKVPDENPDGDVSFFDNVRRKEISRKYSEIDEQVLLKSDGFPTYHLAHLVDDHLMGITDIIRGEEWIVSTPKHVLLYQAFGWEIPNFYHLSLLRNPDKNKSKISKRKNPVSLRWFRAAGYTPEALLNFLALMGYSRSTEGKSKEELAKIELFTIDELACEFEPSRISSSGPAFDYEKLGVINESYIQKMELSEFCSWQDEHLRYLMDYLGDLAPEVKNRFRRFDKEISHITSFLFRLKLDYSEKEFAKIKLAPKELALILKDIGKTFKDKALAINLQEDFKAIIASLISDKGYDSRILHMGLRIACTASAESLPLYESLALLGVYRCIARIDEAVTYLNTL